MRTRRVFGYCSSESEGLNGPFSPAPERRCWARVIYRFSVSQPSGSLSLEANNIHDISLYRTGMRCLSGYMFIFHEVHSSKSSLGTTCSLRYTWRRE